MAGTHGGGIGADETLAVRELRMWKEARRPAQIKNFMRLAVDPAEPDLVAYWPFGYKDDPSTPFENVADWTATDDIPVAPPMTLFAGSYWGGWSEEPVDFSTVQVTLKDGTKSPAPSLRK